METEAQNLLDDTVLFCRRDSVDERVVRMLTSSIPIALDETTFTIQAPTKYALSQLERNKSIIEGYLEEITFAPLALSIVPPSTEMGGPQPASSPAASTPAPAANAPRNTEQPKPAAARSGGVSVTNSLSADSFKRMMAEMKEQEGRRPSATPRTAVPRVPQGDDLPAAAFNSKFTFENFVFGDENKHAYQSSVRFAAHAEDPGSCTSLFIYGNSGLGKTHLLFAIKNYLAKEKPAILVKYANSQAYLDDYMHALGTQKGPGDPIMREYRDADILIIDDIQNIIGKQASIEYFFQLVDEFIRNGKKIVIASDRAPKKLGLDERLTSRFNAGMLCLVSEPGFEMKYMILKRYYENIIMGSSDLEHVNVDTSLLSALQMNEGHLTDQQLRHMAEISGNNIRELESFCERCAGLSSEREQEGRELTAEDIDSIADE